MTDNIALWLSISAGGLAILYGIFSAQWIVKQSAGNEKMQQIAGFIQEGANCLLYTSPSPRDRTRSRMPSSA